MFCHKCRSSVEIRVSWTQKVVELNSKMLERSNSQIFELILSSKQLISITFSDIRIRGQHGRRGSSWYSCLWHTVQKKCASRPREYISLLGLQIFQEMLWGEKNLAWATQIRVVSKEGKEGVSRGNMLWPSTPLAGMLQRQNRAGEKARSVLTFLRERHVNFQENQIQRGVNLFELFAKNQPGVASCGWLQPGRNFLST